MTKEVSKELNPALKAEIDALDRSQKLIVLAILSNFVAASSLRLTASVKITSFAIETMVDGIDFPASREVMHVFHTLDKQSPSIESVIEPYQVIAYISAGLLW